MQSFRQIYFNLKQENNKYLSESVIKEYLCFVGNFADFSDFFMHLDNKIDLNSLDDYILMSSYDNSDISLLEKKIKNLCNISDLLNIDGTYIGNARQIAKLKEAKKNLEDAINSLENKMPVDIANIDINNAWINLGEIIGEVSSDDLLDELFKRFCLGK